MGLKDRRSDERPREKIRLKGVESLSDYELLMAIIGNGNAQADVTKIALAVNKLLTEKGSELSYDDLLAVKSLGPAKAAKIIASFELWKRQFEVSERPVIDSLDKAVELLSDIRNKKQEHFVCITLDGASRLVAKRVITIGTLNASLVHPREVFADAITDRAASIIVAHNHPSGNLIASNDDILITERLDKSSRLLGISLYAHIIVTPNEWSEVLLSDG
ncbi:MAG TPA: DNA repair protein RadC [Candidatus Saccharibacteria bacterium]|nr:DNA repair protein RadC [Candidatus Saccharibacteria bacterium]HMT55470.1 DNA repair protein RadC [Candidatus Saccharibacteria bacterium]